ncbi:hypothetical protein H0N95_00995 [Candidatus Micrarchaeota archaeon]|nr:hypothetical protein [Candidatus Micrarchaeota archaeon]
MKFKDAVKEAGKNEHVKGLAGRGYFLNSGIALLAPGTYAFGDWILTYYNKGENKVIQACVSDGCVDVRPPAEPLNPSKTALDLKRIKTSEEKMMEKAKRAFLAHKKVLSQVIVVIQSEKPFWRFSFITKTLEVVTVEVDAEKGAVTRDDVNALTK